MRAILPAHLIRIDFIITAQQQLRGNSHVDTFLRQRENT
jgi:hypothetical protein